MWNSIVSHANTALAGLIARCVETAWRHPWVAAGFIAALAVLTVLLWIEVVKETMQAPREREVESRPMEIRR